jgi:tyrosinase
MDIRVNHRHMSREQKDAFVDAILLLKNDVDSVLRPGRQRRYDDFVQVHKNAMGGDEQFSPMPHRSPLFFPWHRVFLRQFERALQSAANNPAITLPFWDWSMAGPNDPFTANFMGGNGDSGQNNRVTTGPFTLQRGRFEVRIWDLDLGDPGLRRDFGAEAGAHLPDANLIATAMNKVPYSPGPDSWVNFAEGMLHDPVHRWIGGNMWFPTSPNDPIFFLHHCHLDLLWERWQRQHPTTAPYMPAAEQPGFDLDATLVFNAPGNLAPWEGNWTVRDCLTTEPLDYTYGLFSATINTCVPLPTTCSPTQEEATTS